MTQHAVDLRGRVALVTGASSRLGASIATALARQGANCALHAYSRMEALSSIAQVLSLSAGNRAVPFQADLRDQSAPGSLVKAAVDTFGRLDILVNCAALRTGRRLPEISGEEWDDVSHITVKAAFFCSQAAAPFLADGRGTIINIGSTAAFRPFARGHHYVAAKAALDGVTRSLALELAPDVTVNAVAPGLLASDKSHSGEGSWVESLASEIPMKRLAHPEEVADCVIFLASKGRYITGQTIVIDGGLTIAPGVTPLKY